MPALFYLGKPCTVLCRLPFYVLLQVEDDKGVTRIRKDVDELRTYFTEDLYNAACDAPLVSNEEFHDRMHSPI